MKHVTYVVVLACFVAVSATADEKPKIRDPASLQRDEPVLSQEPKAVSRFDRQAAIHVTESVRKGAVKYHNNDHNAAVVGVDLAGYKGSDRELGNLKLFPHLETLVLIQSRTISDASLAQLCDLTELRSLNLVGCRRITGDGLRHLTRLKKLRTLGLGSTQVDDHGLAHLTSMTALEELNVFDTRVTDAGLKHIAQLTGLRYLDLSSEITDAGLEHLVNLKNLRGLTLRGTRISDEGLRTFAKLTTLEHLDVADTKVTETGLASLREALPDCKVYNEVQE